MACSPYKFAWRRLFCPKGSWCERWDAALLVCPCLAHLQQAAQSVSSTGFCFLFQKSEQNGNPKPYSRPCICAHLPAKGSLPTTFRSGAFIQGFKTTCFSSLLPLVGGVAQSTGGLVVIRDTKMTPQ